MSASSFEPPLTPAAQQQQQQQPNGGLGSAHRRELTPQELATLPVQALLVRTGQLTLDQLSEALRENVASGQSVEEIAVARGWVAPDELQRLREAKAQYAPEAAAAPAPPQAAPAPAPVAPAPAPAPIDAVPEPAPAPVVQAVPDPPPVQPVVQAPAPVAAPAPEPIAVTVPAPSPNTASVGVFLHLEDGERIWVGRFENQEAGELHAQYLIDSLMRPEPGVWPRFGDRLVRPESVVGVEVVPRTD